MADEGGGFRKILSHYFPNTALMLLGEHFASSTRNGCPLPPSSLSLIWAGREFADCAQVNERKSRGRPDLNPPPLP
jgi:hypothetical protein